MIPALARMSRLLFMATLLLLLAACHTRPQDKDVIDTARGKAVARLTRSVRVYQGTDKNPRSLDDRGKVTMVPPSDWTSGFYPGCLWFAYEMSHDPFFLAPARQHTEILKNQKNNATTHDMGFKMCSSYGNGYRLTHDTAYRSVLLESARTLAGRFNPITGCIRSWDHHKNLWEYPVIIDNMMNLELLFRAFRESGDSLFYKIAVSHADHTMRNHFRKDYSSWHVINYDTLTGKVISRNTHQGLSDSSSWARGQAWGLYGFTMCYRYTGKPAYLAQARHIAGYILHNLPEDMVPYWDYDAPHTSDQPRDASAAAIACSALYELSLYTGDSAGYYYDKAEKTLTSLIKNYMMPDTAKSCFILGHSTGSYPAHSEVDVPIIYADYYFLESLIRRDSIPAPSAQHEKVSTIP